MAVYVKMDPVKGESTDDAHKGWMEAESLSFDLSNPSEMGSGQGAQSTGNPHFGDLQFSRTMDGASPDLNAFCAGGKKFANIEIELTMTVGESQKTYMKYKLTDGFITSISCNAGGDMKPAESVSLSYSKIEWEFTTFDHAGGKKADFKKGFNLATNKAV